VGTSANFEGPPNWSPVKNAVTRAAGTGHVTPQKAGSMVRSFVGKCGSPAAAALEAVAAGEEEEAAGVEADEPVAGAFAEQRKVSVALYPK
jgi:hypothetical protein